MKKAEIKILIADLEPFKGLLETLAKNYDNLPDEVKDKIDEISEVED